MLALSDDHEPASCSVAPQRTSHAAHVTWLERRVRLRFGAGSALPLASPRSPVAATTIAAICKSLSSYSSMRRLRAVGEEGPLERLPRQGAEAVAAEHAFDGGALVRVAIRGHHRVCARREAGR